MTRKSGNRYPEEFKQQIVDLYHVGTPVTKLASEYGLIEQTIYKWIKLYSPIIEDNNGATVSMKKCKELQKKMVQLEMENQILKKATAIFAKKTIDEVVAFITEHQTQYPINVMCKVLQICRSTYYKRLHWAISPRELDSQKLDEELQTIYYDSKKRYEAPKIQKVLISNGHRVSLKLYKDTWQISACVLL